MCCRAVHEKGRMIVEEAEVERRAIERREIMLEDVFERLGARVMTAVPVPATASSVRRPLLRRK